MDDKLKALIAAVLLVAIGTVGYVQLVPSVAVGQTQNRRAEGCGQVLCPPCASTAPCQKTDCPTADHCPTCESCARSGEKLNYATKLAAGRKLRVVVSMTTTPCNIWSQQLHNVVLMMKRQTYRPDAIYICIAETGGRDDLPYLLPQWLKEDKDVTVLRTKKDYGPVMKLLPTLLVERDPNTRIVTVDDDWNYPLNMIEHMLEWSLEKPEAALTFTNGWNVTCIVETEFACITEKHGRRFYYIMTQQPVDFACTSDWRWRYGLDVCAAIANTTTQSVHVIQGVGGCMYQRRQFNHEIWDMDQEIFKKNCFFVDDVWISGTLAKRGIERLVVPQFALPADPVVRELAQLRGPRKWQTDPNQAVHINENDMPHAKEKCAGSLHADFRAHNSECTKFFADYFEEDARLEPFYYDAPGFVVDGRSPLPQQ